MKIIQNQIVVLCAEFEGSEILFPSLLSLSFCLICFLVWLDRNLLSSTSPSILWEVLITALVTRTLVVVFIVALVAIIMHFGEYCVRYHETVRVLHSMAVI